MNIILQITQRQAKSPLFIVEKVLQTSNTRKKPAPNYLHSIHQDPNSKIFNANKYIKI